MAAEPHMAWTLRIMEHLSTDQNSASFIEGDSDKMKLFFSEEEYGQIELLPSCNYQSIQAKLHNPNLHSYHRVELSKLEIPVEKYRNYVGETIQNVSQISSCYGGLCHNIFAYAENEMVVVYYEVADGILSTIWLTLDLKTEQSYRVAYDVLNKISHLESLILVDWGWEQTFYLSDYKKLKEYLDARLYAFQRIS